MMMKRTFIPPEYRPYVRGTEMSDGVVGVMESIKNPVLRRQFILDIVKDGKSIPGINIDKISAVFREAFPGIGGSDV